MSARTNASLDSSEASDGWIDEIRTRSAQKMVPAESQRTAVLLSGMIVEMNSACG
jgi:hypothetical protein